METGSREYQKAVQYLSSEIRNGNINIGDRLPTERALAEQLCISRNSTREALRTLENMGLIESRRGSGNYFTGNISKKFSEMIRLLVQIRLVSQKDICDFRRTMEKSVCASIMQRSDTDLSEMQRLLEATPEDTDELPAKDRQFHYLLVQTSDNRFWIEMMDAVSDVYLEWVRGVLKSSGGVLRSRTHNAHQKILAALEAKDRDACEAAIDEHYDIIEDAMGYDSR